MKFTKVNKNKKKYDMNNKNKKKYYINNKNKEINYEVEDDADDVPHNFEYCDKYKLVDLHVDIDNIKRRLDLLLSTYETPTKKARK